MLIAVIGIGGMARRAYLPVLGTRAGLDLILTSRREEPVRAAQAAYRIPRAAADLDELLRAGPQAAFVLTPAPTHFEIAERLLTAGVDVFIEKPATLRAAQTRQLAELADRRGLVLMIGFNRRFAPIHRRARDLLAGKPADLAWLQKDRSSPSSQTLADLYLEDTIHQIDLLRFFCGEGQAVTTRAVTAEDKLVSSAATVALESGGTAVIATSFRAGAWRETYEFGGGGQTVSVEAFQSLHWAHGGGEQRWQEPYASSWQTTLEARGFTPQIEHFLDCVSTRTQPETSGWVSLKTQILLEDMLEKAIT
jgi:virulence factor